MRDNQRVTIKSMANELGFKANKIGSKWFIHTPKKHTVLVDYSAMCRIYKREISRRKEKEKKLTKKIKSY